MRVLLTGATGFLGAQIARVLVEAGCEVVAPLRAGSDRWRIEGIAARLTIVAGDVCSEDFASEAQKWAPDICIHSAWEASAPDYLVSRRNVDLAAGTARLALALRDSGCRRFVGIGTCFEYDTTAGYLSEKAPLGPGHLYSACKAGAGLAVEQIGRGSPMSVAWARLFYLYGPFEPSRRLVPTVVQALLDGRDAAVTPGGQVRDFLHVEDAASALWAIALSAAEGADQRGIGDTHSGTGHGDTNRSDRRSARAPQNWRASIRRGRSYVRLREHSQADERVRLVAEVRPRRGSRPDHRLVAAALMTSATASPGDSQVKPLSSPSVRGNILANLIGKVVSAAVALVFPPLYVRLLGIESYGLVGFFASLTAVLTVLDMGLSATMQRELAVLSGKGEQDALRIGSLTRTFEGVFWAIGFVAAVVVFALAPFIANRWLHANHLPPGVVTKAIRLMGVAIALQWPTGH